MGNLIDFILENIFFFIIVISGMVSLFKGKEKKQDNQGSQRQQTSTPKKVDANELPDIPNSTIAKQTREYKINQDRTDNYSGNLTVEEQWKQQMQRFAGNLHEISDNRDEHSGLTDQAKVADMTRESEVQKLVSKYNHKKFKKEFTSSLTSKGLINSIVMAEVLGKPRAKDPYQSGVIKQKRI